MKPYTPSATLAQLFLHYNEKRINLLLGPIGAGKTVGITMLLLAIAQFQAPDANGFRKTRFAVVRNTRQQLKDSLLKTIFDWLPPNGTSIIWREQDMTLLLNFKLPDDTWVKSEWLCRALDDQQDIGRLLSVEYTVVWLSEFRAIPFSLLVDALSRTGRYPSAVDGGPTWRGILAESNMPARGSDWHRYIELERPPGTGVYIQPSGIGTNAENLQYLEADYYSALMEGATPGWIQAHITSEYPDNEDGKAVYGATFVHSRHVSTEKLTPLGRGSAAPPIIMGIDQGRSPAALFAQVQPDGCLNILSELHASNVSMDTFARTVVVPHVTLHYPGMPIMAVIDPAGLFKGQANDQTPADALTAQGFRVIPAPTNKIDRRLGAVDRLLMLANGLLIDPDCTVLINGFVADYRYAIKKSGEDASVPEKKHPVSDVHDTLQYVALIAGGNNYGKIMRRVTRAATSPRTPLPAARGWT